MSCCVAVWRRWVTSSWRHVVQLRKYGKRQDLVMSHFMHVHKYEFLPKKGHILNHTFKFKDYCPEVFRHLRERFGISDSDYLESFRCACTGNGDYRCNRGPPAPLVPTLTHAYDGVLVCPCSGKYNFIEFISNSKSGQFFFYSHNGRLMIKTQSDVESKFLRRIMPHYYRVRCAAGVWSSAPRRCLDAVSRLGCARTVCDEEPTHVHHAVLRHAPPEDELPGP